MREPTITIRRPRLDWTQDVDRFYFAGDPFKSHLFNALSLLFPDGERFFVRAVHDHAELIRDPKLLDEIRAFTGQEGQHAQQHERFFAVLNRQGYRIGGVLRGFRALAKWSAYLPRGYRLAITAGAEHYTATLARFLLESGMLADCHPLPSQLIAWHAYEEIEHKHVAYDVLAACYPRVRYPLRLLGFATTSAVIGAFTSAGVCSLLAQDRARDRPEVSPPIAPAMRFRRALMGAVWSFIQPGFHPNQHDDRALLARHAP